MHPYRAPPPVEDDSAEVRAWARGVRARRWRIVVTLLIGFSSGSTLFTVVANARTKRFEKHREMPQCELVHVLYKETEGYACKEHLGSQEVIAYFPNCQAALTYRDGTIQEEEVCTWPRR